MSSELCVPYDELEKRRRAAIQGTPTHNRNAKPASDHRLPKLVKSEDVDNYSINDFDIQKLAELKEFFSLLDCDRDGIISKTDLKITYSGLGDTVSDEELDQMLAEAKNPLDINAFLELMTYHIIELDPEEVQLEAWSKWDPQGSGQLDQEIVFDDLIHHGDCMTVAEATQALSYAPMIKPKALNAPPRINYPAFCRILSGIRKPEIVNV